MTAKHKDRKAYRKTCRARAEQNKLHVKQRMHETKQRIAQYNQFQLLQEVLDHTEKLKQENPKLFDKMIEQLRELSSHNNGTFGVSTPRGETHINFEEFEKKANMTPEELAQFNKDSGIQSVPLQPTPKKANDYVWFEEAGDISPEVFANLSNHLLRQQIRSSIITNQHNPSHVLASVMIDYDVFTGDYWLCTIRLIEGSFESAPLDQIKQHMHEVMIDSVAKMAREEIRSHAAKGNPYAIAELASAYVYHDDVIPDWQKIRIVMKEAHK